MESQEFKLDTPNSRSKWAKKNSDMTSKPKATWDRDSDAQ